ncbi:hypothetical protein B0H14DRAFT_3868145 [Mycena olivaceomarginata]|nr:hypothetical protein B0H14DRAFT_3868145 [Mycena olivaceomarginata]
MAATPIFDSKIPHDGTKNASNLAQPTSPPSHHERSGAGDLHSVGGEDHGIGISSENTNKLIAAISEQGESLRILFESAIKAIEAVGPKPKSRDKKIAFWTAYNTLAEEFDKEFREKYKDDLDTSLIFAGLFSAVSSAFII